MYRKDERKLWHARATISCIILLSIRYSCSTIIYSETIFLPNMKIVSLSSLIIIAFKRINLGISKCNKILNLISTRRVVEIKIIHRSTVKRYMLRREICISLIIFFLNSSLAAEILSRQRIEIKLQIAFVSPGRTSGGEQRPMDRVDLQSHLNLPTRRHLRQQRERREAYLKL